MPEDHQNAPIILLAAATGAGQEVLASAAEMLEQFGLRREHAPIAATPTGATQPGWRAVIVASADGTLPGQYARTTKLPTMRVPVEEEGRAGMELLRDDRGNLPNGPGGGRFATMAIGPAGAKNAALFVVAMLALNDGELRERWRAFRERQTAVVLAAPAPSLEGDSRLGSPASG